MQGGSRGPIPNKDDDEATVERVFNHVKHYFGGKCNALLEDYIQAALQLILNDHNNK